MKAPGAILESDDRALFEWRKRALVCCPKDRAFFYESRWRAWLAARSLRKAGLLVVRDGSAVWIVHKLDGGLSEVGK